MRERGVCAEQAVWIYCQIMRLWCNCDNGVGWINVNSGLMSDSIDFTTDDQNAVLTGILIRLE